METTKVSKSYLKYCSVDKRLAGIEHNSNVKLKTRSFARTLRDQNDSNWMDKCMLAAKEKFCITHDLPKHNKVCVECKKENYEKD